MSRTRRFSLYSYLPMICGCQKKHYFLLSLDTLELIRLHFDLIYFIKAKGHLHCSTVTEHKYTLCTVTDRSYY